MIDIYTSKFKKIYIKKKNNKNIIYIIKKNYAKMLNTKYNYNDEIIIDKSINQAVGYNSWYDINDN
jgi:ribosomal protein L31E